MHIIALYIILGILALIALLLSLRAHLHIVYDDELKIFARVLFIKYTLVPLKEKKFDEKKHQKKKEKKQNAPKTVLKERKESDDGSSLLKNINLIKEVLSVAFKAFSRHLHVKISKLHIKVATSDAAHTAILYGAVSGAVASLIELIDSYTNLKKLKKCAVIVEPDFLAQSSEVKIDISLSTSVFGALVTLFKVFWKYTVLKHKRVN